MNPTDPLANLSSFLGAQIDRLRAIPAQRDPALDCHACEGSGRVEGELLYPGSPWAPPEYAERRCGRCDGSGITHECDVCGKDGEPCVGAHAGLAHCLDCDEIAVKEEGGT